MDFSNASSYEIHVFIGCAVAGEGNVLRSPVGEWKALMVFSRQFRDCGYHDYERMERVAREYGWSDMLVAHDGVMFEGLINQARPAVREAYERALECGGAVMAYGEWERGGSAM